MKKIIWISAILLQCCFFSGMAQQNNAKSFAIRGHIDGIENNTKVFLYNIDDQLYLDTAISSGGDFVFKGVVPNPLTCWIECKDQYAIIQVENTEMKFTSPLHNMRINCVITGGKEQVLQNELTMLQHPYEQIYFTLYDSIMKKQYADAADRSRIVKAFESAQFTSQEIYVEFGKRHPNSYLGLDILYRNRERISRDTLALLYEGLTAGLKSSVKARAIKSFLVANLVEKGGMSIDFTARTLEGKAFTLRSLRGKYVLLSFWSANCAPCRMENKKLSRNFERLEKTISIVSFSVDKNKDIWTKASQSDGILWTNVSDLEGENGRIKTQYGVQALPVSFLIDKNGVIIEKFIGFDEDFEARLMKIIG